MDTAHEVLSAAMSVPQIAVTLAIPTVYSFPVLSLLCVGLELMSSGTVRHVWGQCTLEDLWPVVETHGAGAMFKTTFIPSVAITRLPGHRQPHWPCHRD